MGFALSVVIIFFYYAIMTLANAIARGGAIPPMYAVWLPNVIGLIAGFILIYRASKWGFVYEKIFPVENYEQAAVKARELGKNIFLTTGSRNLKIFVELLKDCNLTVRILPTADVLAQCENLGLTPKQIVAMQGPFSVALNVELFKHVGAEVIVTKNSGQIGGADTKLEAAKLLNLPVVMVNRPKIFYPNLAETFDDVLNLIGRS